MTKSSRSFDAASYLSETQGLSFSRVGVYMLIRSHLVLSPKRVMSRAGIHAALRTRTPFAVELVDSVITEYFEIDADGFVFSPKLNAQAEAA